MFGVIAYYATSFEGDEKKLYITLETDSMNEIWIKAKNNENQFPNGQLMKIEIIPSCN